MIFERRLKRNEKILKKIGKRINDGAAEAEADLKKAQKLKEQYDEITETEKFRFENEDKRPANVEALRGVYVRRLNDLIKFYNNNYGILKRKVKIKLWLRNLLIAFSTINFIGMGTFLTLFLTKGNDDVAINDPEMSIAGTSEGNPEVTMPFEFTTESSDDNNLENVAINDIILSALSKYSILASLDNDKFREFIMYLNIDELGISPSDEDMQQLEKSFFEVLEIISSYNMDSKNGPANKINCDDFIINDYYKQVISRAQELRNSIVMTGGATMYLENLLTLSNYLVNDNSSSLQVKHVLAGIIDEVIETLRGKSTFDNFIDELEKVKDKLINDTTLLAKYNQDAVFNHSGRLARTRSI